MLDGRAAERFAITLPVELMSAIPTDARQALMRNISSHGGIFLYARKDAAMSTEIDFAITLPEQLTHREGMRVECKATVVRVEPGADEVLVGVAATITSLKLTAPQKAEA